MVVDVIGSPGVCLGPRVTVAATTTRLLSHVATVIVTTTAAVAIALGRLFLSFLRGHVEPVCQMR
jgi:hypothetical protein